MKKTILSIAIIFTTVFLLSCKKSSNDPTPSTTNSSSTTSQSNNLLDTSITTSGKNERLDVCSIKTDLVHLALAGLPCKPKKWSLEYFDGNNNTRLSIPGLISPTISNTFYWEANDSLKEFSYQGNLIDVGTWKLENCGAVSVLNTQLTGGQDNTFTLEIVRYNFWQGSFYLPLGPNGTLVLVRARGYLVH